MQKQQIARQPSQRSISSTSSEVLPMADEPLAPGATIQGYSGRIYTIGESIVERRDPLLCVYRASVEGKKFILKNMIPGEYEYQKDLQESVSYCPHLRTIVDGVPGPDLFIYPFLETNLLQFSQNKLLDTTRKFILKNALVGLATLHEKNIIHDIKPDNILLDYEVKDTAFHVKRVQIADLEDSVILPDGKHLENTMCGNQLWRSPESWARAAQGISSDIFSFGIVSIYVMLNDMVLRASKDELAANDAWRWVLGRQISFFAKEEEFKGLLKWIGEENPFYERLITLADSFDYSASPRKPFEYWEFVDASFRDLIGKMTALDPAKRITAKNALMHPWFSAN
ncbi:uncharacterized protein RCO7_11469 [Rhynchosporium graminicola]|uniref:Protein kinase domain-containing protein n=1 Tax=Rhynchosporium graminicola TaxID=2792576 RepID=A0A1E1LPY3_9HELO|nr:uncharacterized protein RCO7_11469 [Rhynchosporium commune]